MEKFRKKFFKIAQTLFEPPVICHSTYAVMPNGPMKHGSIGRTILRQLKEAYVENYEDKPDKETLLAAIGANYVNETELAWQAFLAEIGEND